MRSPLRGGAAFETNSEILKNKTLQFMKTILYSLFAVGSMGLTFAEDSYVVVLSPTSGNIAKGIVTFEEGPDEVVIKAHVSGLKPNSKHGFHIHEFGDVSASDGKAAGGHFNPAGLDHALPGEKAGHAGDLGNLEANESGVAILSLNVEKSQFPDGLRSILGRGMIVHANPDDGGQPTGNAGDRIASGVIGLRNPDSNPFALMNQEVKTAKVGVVTDPAGDPLEKAKEAAIETGETISDGVKDALRTTGKALKTVADAVEEEIKK